MASGRVFVVCVVGGWGWGQAIYMLNDNRVLFEVRSPIEKRLWLGLGFRWIPRLGPGQSLTLVGYTSVLSKIPEARVPLHV